MDEPGPTERRIRRSRLQAGFWLVRIGCLTFLLALAGTVMDAGLEIPPAIAAETVQPGVVIATLDGLLTATFPETTDDAALKAAIPGLVAKGVQSIGLRGVPVRDIRPLAACRTRVFG